MSTNRRQNRQGTAEKENGQRRPSTSQEYDRFESLVKRIVRVPKKEIDAARKREARNTRGARHG